MTRILSRLDEVALNYDAILCDLWGCLHNGKQPFPEAVAALQAFRAGGGVVVLLTNAPRPRQAVMAQLDRLGVPRDCWDVIATSGDAAQVAMAAGAYGRRVYHIGPDKDLIFFEDENGVPFDIARVPLDEAEGIVCTGLFDDQTETPADYRHTILTGVNRGLKLLCANPDIVVDLGDKRIYCGGAIAAAYAEAGGESHYFGKPHAPIYALARQRLGAEVERIVDDGRILAIGDGIATDIAGAVGEDIDSVFISGGLAAEDTGTPPGGQPDPDRLDAFFKGAALMPTYAMGYLR